MTSPSSVGGITARVSAVHFFDLPEGKLSYEDSGTSSSSSSSSSTPVYVCIEGMGDTRGQFRLLAPKLLATSARVIVVDARGQGDSSTTFTSYLAKDVGHDVIALMEHLRVENAVVVGNSSGGAACAWIAVHSSPRVKGVVLLGAVLRDMPMSVVTRAALWLMFAGPWATWSWMSFYNSIYKQRPADHAHYTAALRQSMGEPGKIAVLRAMLAATKASVTAILASAGAGVGDMRRSRSRLRESAGRARVDSEDSATSRDHAVGQLRALPSLGVHGQSV